jgi:uncharacterized membrane protein
MKRTRHKYVDKDIEVIMGNILRFGVLLSTAIVLFGSFLYFRQHGHEVPNYTRFSGEPQKLKGLTAIFEAAIKGSSRGIIQFGLLVLIATPIARIIFSIIGFVLEKDILYTLITLFVLAIILVSLFSTI